MRRGRNSSGTALAQPELALLDASPGTGGIQELKVWQAVAQAIAALAADNAGLLPASYSSPSDRMRLCTQPAATCTPLP